MMIDAAAALPHVRHDEPRHADGRIQRLVERLLPLGVGRVDDVGAFGGGDVVDEDVDAAEGLERGVDDLLRRLRAVDRSAATAIGRPGTSAAVP